MTEEQGAYALECARRIAEKTRFPSAVKQDLASMIVAHVVEKWEKFDPSRSSWRTWVARSAKYGYQIAVRRLQRDLGRPPGGPPGPLPPSKKGTSQGVSDAKVCAEDSQ